MDYNILTVCVCTFWIGRALSEDANETVASRMVTPVAPVSRGQHLEHGDNNQDPNQLRHGFQDIPTEKEPDSSRHGLQRKVSVQSTFTFTTETRCLNFLKRLKSKGLNENPSHPLTCPATFDGILCWRPADPGEELHQVCPEGPTNLQSFAKRECVDGRWKEYHDAGNERLNVHGINQTDFSECFQVAGFLRKHGIQSSSAEMQGPAISEYGYPTSGPATNTDSYHAPRPEDYHTTASSQAYDGHNAPIQKPFMIVDIHECQRFLRVHDLDDTHDGTWCRGMSDRRMCWPATAPGVEATQPCQKVDHVSVNTINATRYCGVDGNWNTSRSDGSIGSSDPDNGWTNYDACDIPLTPQVGETQAAMQPLSLGDLETDPKQTEVPPSEILITVTAVPDPNPTTVTPAAEVAHQGYGAWKILTAAECEQYQRKSNRWEGEAGSCKGGTDGTICWPTTTKNTIASEYCPPIHGLETQKTVARECGADGQWKRKSGKYTDCFTQEMKDIMKHDFGVNANTAAVRFPVSWMVISFVFTFLLLCS